MHIVQMLNEHISTIVDASFAKELPDNYIRHLFPQKEEDEVLRILLQIKEMYQDTELGEMLERIYL